LKTHFRRLLRAAVAVTLVAIAVVAVRYWQERQLRESLYAALRPVHVTNCDMQRYGSANDGGYVLCANLLKTAGAEVAAYSYGIAGVDDWGCHVAGELGVAVHQYDCFQTTVASCANGASHMFHAECIGPARESIEGRPFDTLGNQISKNGDGGKRIILKMDVEGSEWESLRTANDATLQAIDQIAIEFHGIEDPAYIAAAERLAQFFYVANIHANNHVCLPGFDPYPGTVFEALLVNKRIAAVDPGVTPRIPSAADAPNNPLRPDCQPVTGRSEPERIAQWLRRVAGVIGARVFGTPFS
jgi:hypothetical protein